MTTRTRNPNRKPLVVCMPPALIERLDASKDEDMRSRNSQIIYLLEGALDARDSN